MVRTTFGECKAQSDLTRLIFEWYIARVSHACCRVEEDSVVRNLLGRISLTELTLVARSRFPTRYRSPPG